MMQQLNTAGNGQYYYLCDSEGEIIYHPRQAQMNDGIGSENSIETAGYGAGVYDEDFGGERREHEYSVVIPLSFYHPCNRFKRIVKEMRVNLSLKRIQLAFPPLILFQNDLPHKHVDLLVLEMSCSTPGAI